MTENLTEDDREGLQIYDAFRGETGATGRKALRIIDAQAARIAELERILSRVQRTERALDGCPHTRLLAKQLRIDIGVSDTAPDASKVGEGTPTY